jgi:Contact-dependent growth inhibition CdiA C-terminal domain
LQRQNESARTLAAAGYTTEQLPEIPGDKNTDYLIEGKIFDNLAPTTDRPRNIASRIQEKFDDEQTERIVLNMADTPVEPDAMREQLHNWPIPGLKEVIVIDKNNQIIHLYP